MTKKKILFDYSKLKGRIKEKGFTQEDVARKCGFSAATLNYKLSNTSYFTALQILNIAKILEIAPEEIDKYFFAIQVKK